MNIIHNETSPDKIRVPENKHSLFLQWEGEDEIEVAASTLRDHCRSAGSLSLAVKGLAAPARGDLSITMIKQVGSYGLNISFSDGQERGIYPWQLLRSIATNPDLKPAV